MRYINLLAIFLCCFSQIQAQSLESQFAKAATKQEQMQIAMQIAQQNKDGDSRKGAAYAQKAYDLANDGAIFLGWSRGIYGFEKLS
jgi:hypothetical protein